MSQSIIFVLIILIIIVITTSCAQFYIPTYKGQPSDHFNGKKFFNPENDQMGDFRSLIKYNRTHKRAKWDFNEVTYEFLDCIDDFNESGTVRYFHINHASMLLQIDGMNILTDPVYSLRASPFEFLGPKRYRHPGIPFDKLPRIDLVLISHDHYDHLDTKTLKKLLKRDNPKILVGLGLKRFLRRFKLLNVEELDWHETIKINKLNITFTPAHHWSNRGFSPKKTLWGSYYIEGSSSVYFAGDTAYGNHFLDIKEKYGSPDLALIPIGAYLPRDFMLHVHMDPKQALQAHLDLESKESYAIHWGTFQLTHEGMEDPIIALKEECDLLNVHNFYFDKIAGNQRIFQSTKINK